MKVINMTKYSSDFNVTKMEITGRRTVRKNVVGIQEQDRITRG